MDAVWLALLMVAIVLALRHWQRGKANAHLAKLDAIARELGLEVTRFDGLGAVVRGGAATTETADRGLATFAAAVFGERRALHGERDGRAVSIGVLPAPRYRIAVAARCRVPREIGLWVRRRGSVLGSAPDRATAVSSGDAEFDAATEVAARDAATAASLLALPDVRRALRELLAANETACLRDDWVCVLPYTDDVRDAADARRLLDTVTRLAAPVDRALDVAPLRPGSAA